MPSLISVRTSVRTFHHLPPSICTFRSPSVFFPPLSYDGVSSVNHHLTVLQTKICHKNTPTMPPRKYVDPQPVTPPRKITETQSTKSPEPVTEPQIVEVDPQDEAVDEVEIEQQDVTLAETLTLITNELRNRDSKKPNIKSNKPDTFDGSDAKKLNNFILLCSLTFRSNPNAYSDDGAKVTFALSYLRGMALEFFDPSLLSFDDLPDWLDDWSLFVKTLRTQFGPIDPTADAEDSLDNLKMRDNQRILKYNVEFNRLSIQTGWSDGVLRHRYYAGLAERIKDIMGQQGKPSTLTEMKTLAHSIDSRHWERLREKSCSDAKTSKPDGKSTSTSKPDQKSDNKSNNSASKNKPSASTSNTNNNTNNKSAKPSTFAKTIADKLGKDGKLNTDERQRRFDNNLCLYCGGTGHKTAECKKATASKTKARAAQVPPKDKDDSKKA